VTKQRAARREPQPVTRHPLFPALVALWFGALFGMASLAVSPALFESLILKSGIDTVIPAAAPPLGFTARILIALGLAALGGLIGGVLGRWLARTKPEADEADDAPIVVRKRNLHPDAPTPRPLDVLADIGEDIAPIAAPEPEQPLADTAPQMAESLPSFEVPEPTDLPLAYEVPEVSPELLRAGPEAAEPEVEAGPQPAAVEAPQAAADAQDLIALSERLAAALAARRARQAEAEAAEPPVPFVQPSPFARSLPAPPVEEFAEEDDEPEDEEVYGSLLELGRDARTAPVAVQIDPANAGEPVVIFPGQAAAAPLPPPHRDNDATVQALRSALATLQRQSGAA
jgi:hypothetical protein